MTDEAGQAHAPYYSDDLVANLQRRWGAGFMSPGGAGRAQSHAMGYRAFRSRGPRLRLWIGAYDRLLVTAHGASAVYGIDLGAPVIAEAQAKAEADGLGGRLHYRVVEPGPIPFEEDRFGFVFSKDAIVEVPDGDKPDVLRELFRVTAPGGCAILSDRFCGPDEFTEEMRVWAGTGDETYDMVTIQSAADWLRQAGFMDLSRIATLGIEPSRAKSTSD